MTVKNSEQELRPSEQLLQVQREVMRMQQEVHAMQCVMDGLVAMHPKPEELLKICRQVQAVLTGSRAEEPGSDAEPNLLGLTGWRTVMRRYIDILEQGSRLRKPSTVA